MRRPLTTESHRVTKKAFPSLRAVPPGGLPAPTPEEALQLQRDGAEQAIAQLREALRHVEEAQRLFDSAHGIAEKARLPGVDLMEHPDRPDVGERPWPGALVIPSRAWWDREYRRRALREDIKALKNALHRFMRGQPPV